jgi:hypothetical protein
VTTADIDGWHARDLIAPLFFNDNTELHNLIRKRLILPYLTGFFHPSFIEEYAETGWIYLGRTYLMPLILLGGLLMALQKQDGSIRPILCGEIWRRCFASLAVNATPVRKEAVKFFTSTYDNFIQTAGIRDGASHCAKILSVFYDNLDTSDPNDPEVIIRLTYLMPSILLVVPYHLYLAVFLHGLAHRFSPLGKYGRHDRPQRPRNGIFRRDRGVRWL